MANTFKSETFTGGATAANTDMTVYTVPSATTTIIIGLTISNLTNNSITVDVKLVSSADDDIHIRHIRQPIVINCCFSPPAALKTLRR